MSRAEDIVAILIETDVRTRRERAAFVAKLRDEMGLTFRQIATQLNVTPSRAQQLYMLHLIFKRSAGSPFADLSARARHFLDILAYEHSMPKEWEQQPAMIEHMFKILSSMTRREASKYRQLGHKSLGEIDDFLRQNRGQGFYHDVYESADLPGEAKDYTAPVSSQEMQQRVAEFFNQHELAGEFKVWPKGTYHGANGGGDFTVTLSGFLADAWEENWRFVQEFDLMLAGFGYKYEMETPSTLYFFREEPSSAVAPSSALQNQPAPNLDIEI